MTQAYQAKWFIPRMKAEQKSPENLFEPAPYVNNGHVQTIISSLKVRRPLISHRSRAMLNAALPRILDCGEGTRLMGYYSPHRQNPAPDLCVLIHGWEGDSNSTYLVSAAGHLWQQGYDIFRLNLRDHGPTHHLNQGLFHACRLNETIGAMKWIQETFAFRRLFLVGFSLGGNFALRIGANARKAGLRIEQIVAVCPVLNPEHTVEALAQGFPLYHWYFLRKWRRSLKLKQNLFPGLVDLGEIRHHKSIRTLTEYFVRRYTEFDCADDYFSGYSLMGSRLAGLNIASTIIASADDPVIPAADLDQLATTASLSIEKYPYGGHCGFIPDWRMESWVNSRFTALFQKGDSPESGAARAYNRQPLTGDGKRTGK